MVRVLKSLMVFLIVVAFGAATIDAATALPCAAHDAVVSCQGVSATKIDAGCERIAAERAEQHVSHRASDGKCIHGCCAGCLAIAASQDRPHKALPVTRAVFTAPNDSLLAGIGLAPPIGPPKLSA